MAMVEENVRTGDAAGTLQEENMIKTDHNAFLSDMSIVAEYTPIKTNIETRRKSRSTLKQRLGKSLL